MPQMAPLNWLFLYLLFIIIFMIFNFMNYYLFIYMNNMINNKLSLKNKILSWKW